MNALTTTSAGTLRRVAPFALPLATLVAVLAFSLAEPAFLSTGNLVGILRQMALIGIMAACTTFVIMTGGVDLSVGPVLAIAGLVRLLRPASGRPLGDPGL